MLLTQNSAEVYHHIIHTKPAHANKMRLYIYYMLENREKQPLQKTLLCLLFCAQLELPHAGLCEVGNRQQDPHIGPPHSQGCSLPQQKLLLRCTEVPGLSVSLCTEGNKTQQDFSEHYKFLVEVDPTRPWR